MFKHFLPDRQINSYGELTPEALSALGVRLLITDIDNTLVPYGDAVPTDEVRRWIDGMRRAGIDVALLSNNGAERVELFNAGLGLFAMPKSKKPGKKAVLRVIEHFGASKETTALLGDQLFTDVLCGKRAGVYTVLTERINDEENRFIKFKRLCEIPIRRALGLNVKKRRHKV